MLRRNILQSQKKILEHIKVDGTVLSSGKDALDEQVKQIINHHDETANKNQKLSTIRKPMKVILYGRFVKGKWGF